jgi:hypothetical protein
MAADDFAPPETLRQKVERAVRSKSTSEVRQEIAAEFSAEKILELMKAADQRYFLFKTTLKRQNVFAYFYIYARDNKQAEELLAQNYDYITLQQKYKLMETVKVTEPVVVLQE